MHKITQHSPAAPNAKPVHIALRYDASCAGLGAFVCSASTVTPSAAECLSSVELYTTVEIASPNAVPSWVSVWKSAPPTDCSCGRQLLAMKSVPVAKTKSAPKTERMVAGNPKAQ